MRSTKISLVAALSENRVIGNKGEIPWKIPGEQKRFREITTPHPIIMGRKTYESIGRILPGRMNIVVTRDESYKVEGATMAHSVEQAIEIAKNYEKTPLRQGFAGQGEICIIGGGQIYADAIKFADILHLTIVHKIIEGDTYFPDYSMFTKIISKEEKETDGYKYTYLELEKE